MPTEIKERPKKFTVFDMPLGTTDQMQRRLCIVGRRAGHKTAEWGEGISGYCIWLDNFKVVEEFEAIDWEEAESYFEKKHNPILPGPLQVSPAWLSPEGHFYACGYAAHTATANRIAACLDIPLEGHSRYRAEDTLLARGWVKLTWGWTLVRRRDEVSQKQHDVLFDLSLLADSDSHWRSSIDAELEDLKEAR